jgi:hypothetical protein
MLRTRLVSAADNVVPLKTSPGQVCTAPPIAGTAIPLIVRCNSRSSRVAAMDSSLQTGPGSVRADGFSFHYD